MPDYKESSVSGTQWQRCNAVVVSNPYGEVPTITLREEQITTVGGQQFRQDRGGIEFPFDPAYVVNLKNPVTGEALGATMTCQEIYVALWSMYMQKAAERDAQ